MSRLVLKFETETLKEVPLGTRPVTIGRAPDNDIRLDGLQISNRHARFMLTNGGVSVEDEGSTNGVYVNGERIIPSVTRVFTNNQELYVFFQAYLPANVDGSKTQAGLVFYRNGQIASETPLVEPADVNAKTRTASFRVNLPLDKLPVGSYTIQAVVVQDDDEQAAFGRNYFALRPAAIAH